MRSRVSIAFLERALDLVTGISTTQRPHNSGDIFTATTTKLMPYHAASNSAEQRWTVGSLATAATFVSSGLGFAWLPRHLIERELREGLLKQLPLEKGGSRNPTFYLYSNKDKPLGPATQILVELLRTFDTAPLDAPFAAPQQA